jgi:hypothetical protein
MAGACLLAAWLATSSAAGMTVGRSSGPYQSISLQTKSDVFGVRVVRTIEGSVALRIDDAGRQSSAEVRLNDATREVVEVTGTPDGQRVVAIGKATAAVTVDVVDVANATNTLSVLAFVAAVSPDKRYVVYQCFYRRNDPRPVVRFVSLPLEGTPEQMAEAAASGFYPRDQASHTRQSSLFWVQDDTVAFLELADDTARVVVAQMRGLVGAVRVATRDLDADQLVKPGVLPDSTPLSFALYDPTITALPGPGLRLRLRFPNEPALLARRVDLTMWE